MNHSYITKLEPSINASFKKLIENKEGLCIIFSDREEANKNIILNFGHSVHSYKRMDIAYIAQNLNFLLLEQDIGFPFKNGLFKMHNSNYIHALSTASHGMLPIEGTNHFIIIADNIIIEIIAVVDPKILVE